MRKKRNSGRKKIDIYQKSFSFTHRYNKEKYDLEKLNKIKNNFAIKINNRLILSAIVFSSLFLAVAIKMTEVSLLYTVKGSYFVENTENTRGNILDRNNTFLTANLLTSHISVNPKAIYDKDKFVSKISTINNRLSHDEIGNLISQNKFFWLDYNVEPIELQKYIDLGETGIEFRDAYKRKYLHSELFSHLIGKVDRDNTGVSGLEKSYDSYLKDNEKDDLILSLDTRIQHIVRDELLSAMKLYKAKGGSGLVMNVNNGEILAMTSLPDFDPNTKLFNYSSNYKIADNQNKFNKNT